MEFIRQHIIYKFGRKNRDIYLAVRFYTIQDIYWEFQ